MKSPDYSSSESQWTFFTPHSVRAVPRWLFHLPPLVICFVYFAVLIFLSRAHPFGTDDTETDFYHYFAPDALRLLKGEFPENPFQGPGYPALLVLITKLTGDVFVAGKWISMVSAVLLAWLTFVLFRRLFGYPAGIAAQLLLIVSGELPQFSFQATTDVFFLLLCVATLVIITGERFPLSQRTAFAGALTGLAYLARYNGVFLVIVCLAGITFFNLYQTSWRERGKQVALFVVIFLLTVSPWLMASWQHYGSPLYNKNYLNVATQFYPELTKGNVFQEGTRLLDQKFHSFGEVLAYDPPRILKGYPVNLWESLQKTVTSTLIDSWTVWAAIIGLIFAASQFRFADRRGRRVWLLLFAGLLYVLMMALNHWETRYYFFLMLIYVGLAAYAAIQVMEIIQKRIRVRYRAWPLLASLIIIAVLFAKSFIGARQDVKGFLSEHPWELRAASDFIQQTGAAPHTLKIVSRKPHLAFFSEQQWVFIPQVNSLEELREWMLTNHLDYLAIGKREIRDRPALKPLGDPATAPAWLRAVWKSEKPLFILYRPQEFP